MDENSLIKILGIVMPVLGMIITAYFVYSGKVKEIALQQKLADLKEKQEKDKKEIGTDQDSKIEKLMKIFQDRIDGLDRIVTNMQESLRELFELLKNHTDKDGTMEDFMGDINFKSNEIVNLSFSLDEQLVYKNILLQWADEIQLYGLFYFANKKKKMDIETTAAHLRQNIEKHISKFYSTCDYWINTHKKYHGDIIKFSDLAKLKKIHNCTYALAERLIENKLENKQTTEKFTEYIGKFFKLFVSLVDAWNLQEDYEYGEEGKRRIA